MPSQLEGCGPDERWIIRRIAFGIVGRYYTPMNARHRKTLVAVFVDPLRADVRWRDIEGLFSALEAEVSEGRGSRVNIKLRGLRAVFHRPHPQPVTDKGALKAVRRFLKDAGVEP